MTHELMPMGSRLPSQPWDRHNYAVVTIPTKDIEEALLTVRHDSFGEGYTLGNKEGYQRGFKDGVAVQAPSPPPAVLLRALPEDELLPLAEELPPIELRAQQWKFMGTAPTPGAGPDYSEMVKKMVEAEVELGGPYEPGLFVKDMHENVKTISHHAHELSAQARISRGKGSYKAHKHAHIAHKMAARHSRETSEFSHTLGDKVSALHHGEKAHVHEAHAEFHKKERRRLAKDRHTESRAKKGLIHFMFKKGVLEESNGVVVVKAKDALGHGSEKHGWKKGVKAETIFYRGMSKEGYEEFKRTGIVPHSHHANVMSTDIETARYHASQHDEPGVIVRFKVHAEDIEHVEQDTISEDDFRIAKPVRVQDVEVVTKAISLLLSQEANALVVKALAKRMKRRDWISAKTAVIMKDGYKGNHVSQAQACATAKKMWAKKSNRRKPPMEAKALPDWVWLMTGGIAVNAEELQYKNTDGAADGLNDQRRQEDMDKPFDPLTVPPIAVWKAENGQVYVVDGHKRLDHAKRKGIPNIRGFFIEASSFKDAKEKGEKLNVKLGTKALRPEGEGSTDD